MNQEREMHLVVSYIGHEPWKHPFRPEDSVHTVKVEAMTKSFDLEEASADNYVLQFNGADLPEATKIGTVGTSPLSVDLVLKKEPHKGK